VLHSDIVPEHEGELIELTATPAPVQCARCSARGTEFTYQPDCEWVTFVLPRMREMIES